MASIEHTLATVLSHVAALPTSIGVVQALGDESLVEAQRKLAEIRRAVDACSSLVAGEIGVRSHRSLGYAGLAQREGFRTPEALVQHTIGSNARDASTLVKVGAMIHGALANPTVDDAALHHRPGAWQRVIGRAVSSGSLSVDAARAIRTGLGDPVGEGADRGVSEHDLSEAVEVLLAEAPRTDVDRLLRRARELRDQLDAAGIADRERRIHLDRGVRRVRRDNGLSRYIIDPDLESGAFWDDLYDRLTAPRRGGPRFVDENEKQRADSIANDSRSIEQYVHDSVTELLRLGATSNDSESRRIVGARVPAVRVLVTRRDLASREGHGRIEGSEVPISIETVERMACAAGTVQVAFDEQGQVLNLGREQRRFSHHQRVAMAARDGGCRAGDCDRPPSWTEAHHIDHWERDAGDTNIAKGILLCRYHHLLLHNNHWEIEQRGGEYWLIPPPDVDPSRTPRLMPSKSAAIGDLQRQDRAS